MYLKHPYIYIYAMTLSLFMKNRDKELNLMEIDVKLLDFAEVIAGIVFIISVVGIISGSLSSSSVHAVQSQSKTASAGFTVAPQNVKGPGGSGGGTCTITYYTGGLQYDEKCCVWGALCGIEEVKDCAKIVTKEGLECQISAIGTHIKIFVGPTYSTNVAITCAGNCPWYPPESAACSSSGPMLIQPGTTVKGITGTEYIWSVSFSNSRYNGFASSGHTIQFAELIGYDNGQMEDYGESSVNGNCVVHWGSIIGTLIGFAAS